MALLVIPGRGRKPASPESIRRSAAEYGFRARRFAPSRNDGELETGLRKAKRTRPTLKDIAREVGVHVSTISRALNPQSTHAVSPDLMCIGKAFASLFPYEVRVLNRGMTLIAVGPA